jgi:hypothetical protein
MNGNELAKRSVVTNDGKRLLTIELKVLGDSAHNSTGEDIAVLTYASTLTDGHIRTNTGTLTYLYIPFYTYERVNNN